MRIAGYLLILQCILGIQTINSSDQRLSRLMQSDNATRTAADREVVRAGYLEKYKTHSRYSDLRERMNDVTPKELLPIFSMRRSKRQKCFDRIDCLCFERSGSLNILATCAVIGSMYFAPFCALMLEAVTVSHDECILCGCALCACGLCCQYGYEKYEAAQCDACYSDCEFQNDLTKTLPE